MKYKAKLPNISNKELFCHPYFLVSQALSQADKGPLFISPISKATQCQKNYKNSTRPDPKPFQILSSKVQTLEHCGTNSLKKKPLKPVRKISRFFLRNFRKDLNFESKLKKTNKTENLSFFTKPKKLGTK